MGMRGLFIYHCPIYVCDRAKNEWIRRFELLEKEMSLLRLENEALKQRRALASEIGVTEVPTQRRAPVQSETREVGTIATYQSSMTGANNKYHVVVKNLAHCTLSTDLMVTSFVNMGWNMLRYNEEGGLKLS